MEFKLRKIERKGDLTNNFLSLVIAVIGIALIVFGIVKLYQLRLSDEEKNARNFLDSVLEKVNALDVDESNEFVFQGFKNAEQWELHGFDLNDDERPDECFFESCLCVCEKEDDCKEIRFCENVGFDNVLVRTVERYSEKTKYRPSNVDIGTYLDEKNGLMIQTMCDKISFQDSLISLNVVKSDGALSIIDGPRILKTKTSLSGVPYVAEDGTCINAPGA